MANREELGIIRGARAGRPAAQLELGKRYLFGSAGLPKSLPTALHWLDRAAQQGCDQSCALIGTHIPFEVAAHSQRPVARWFERAYDAGIARAGLVLAQLTSAGLGAARRERALAAPASAPQPEPAPALEPAKLAGASQAWEEGDTADFLERALPLARQLVQNYEMPGPSTPRLTPEEAGLLARCARALEQAPAGQGVGQDELGRFLEVAASENEPGAQLAIGLWHARMRVDGERVPGATGSANFKKAIRWLTLAGEQGLAPAWYALSRIYIKPEFSQRNVIDAQRYLERAADMGYRDAQLECGNSAWRARREHESNDVRALYWLQKAAEQGCPTARVNLEKIAPRVFEEGRWEGALETAAALANTHPLLAARLELAHRFGLTRAEALLLDVQAADHGHCIVIDIRSSYGRSKRRLVMLDSAEERAFLDRIVSLFEGIDMGPGGLEGNYRQRLYRLKTLAPDLFKS